MELRQLRYFVTVADELHFGRAADRLHIVQSAVSQQVRRLEAELGISLLDRTTRRVTLTAAGQRFLPEARAVLAAAERARESIADLVAARATMLRLGTSTGLGERLPRVLAALREGIPGQAVELVSMPARDRLTQTADGGLDAALVRGIASHPGLRLHPVWEDELVAALPASHPLAGNPSVALSQLAQLPLRMVPRDVNPPLVDLLFAACRANGLEPRLGPPAGTDQDMLAAIGTGPATWTVYYTAQARMLTAQAAGVAFVAIDPPLHMPTSLALPATGSSPVLQALLEACRAAATDVLPRPREKSGGDRGDRRV
jgi:DNA-binding transcriptional LysR family regulator